MESPVNNKDIVIKIGELLKEHKCENTIVLYVGDICSWTDYFVLTTVRSHVHMHGLMKYLNEFFATHHIIQLNHRKNMNETGWILLDCGDIIIHLMEKEQREFYELERLWFKGTIIYSDNSL
ncbi:MAG: ribosome silencing factor [Spirochaetales bacterium]|nr:ribosome silencing factor [Spirochaetales bacterium]